MANHQNDSDYASSSPTPSAASLPSGIDAAKVADGSVSNAEFQRLDGVGAPIATTTGTQTLTNKTLTAPVVNSPTGIVKGDVGLGNVDNTSDANKPVSSAQQTALDLKAPLASPTFTGTVTAPVVNFTNGSLQQSSGYTGIWLEGTPTLANYAMLTADSGERRVNGTTSLNFYLSNAFQFGVNANGLTPNGILVSGTYTPTASAATNLDATPTMTEAQYMRVGKTVTVSGRFTADPTAAIATSFEITLPIASNLGAAEDAAGTAFSGGVAGQGAEVIGVAANNTAQFQWVAVDVTSKLWSYTFSYQII